MFDLAWLDVILPNANLDLLVAPYPYFGNGMCILFLSCVLISLSLSLSSLALSSFSLSFFFFSSLISGCVCFMLFHSSLLLHVCPSAPLLASSSAASFFSSLLCPLSCSNLICLLIDACGSNVFAFAARYLLLSALYSPVVIFAAYFES